MERRTARDFDRNVLRLFDDLVHGRLDRRGFLERAAAYATATMSAAAMLEALSPRYAQAQQVAPDDPRIVTERVTYESPRGHGRIMALLAKPANATEPLPGVLVVHENRGLNPYIEDVARRLAVAGFVALAPDGLSPYGGYPGNDEEGRAMQAELDADQLFRDFVAGFDYLRSREDTTGRVGVVGFCYGGGVANRMAVELPELAAAVPFYGRQPAVDLVPQIRAPLLIHYAGNDDRINEGAAMYEAALQATGKSYTIFVYEGVEHGFHNDTTPRYDKEAAELAWQRTIDFLRENLA